MDPLIPDHEGASRGEFRVGQTGTGVVGTGGKGRHVTGPGAVGGSGRVCGTGINHFCVLRYGDCRRAAYVDIAWTPNSSPSLWWTYSGSNHS